MAQAKADESMSFQYLFTGNVHPLNLGISTGQHRVRSLGFGEILFNVTNSKICGSALSEKEVTRYDYLRQAIQEVVQGYMNIVALKTGVHLHVDMQEIIDVEKASVTLLPLSKCFAISKLGEDKRCELERMALIVFNTKHSNTLQSILADMNTALLDVSDAGFLCYRSIESMRSFLLDRRQFLGGNSDFDYWAAFREHLGAERDDILRVKKAADRKRHGEYFNMKLDEYDWIMKYTWELLFLCLTKITDVELEGPNTA